METQKISSTQTRFNFTDSDGRQTVKAIELQNELGKAKARIAELEFQMSLKWPGVWQPVVAPSGEKVEMFTDGRVVVLDEDGLYYVYDVDHSEHCMGFGLPEGYAICRKIQPAA